MKSPIARAIIFLSLFLIIASGLQFCIDYGLRNSEFSEFREWNQIFRSQIQSNLIIQGSSRAYVHFSPQAIDSGLNVSSYNLGMDGYGFLMEYYRYLLYRENNPKPKYIVQSLDINLLRPCGNLFQSEQFLPYLGNPLIREAASHYSGSFDFKDFAFPLYKYHNNPRVVYAGLVSFFFHQKLQNRKYRGFRSSNKTWDSTYDAFQARNPKGVILKTDSLNLALFRKFLAGCAEEGIQVVLVYPPEYIRAQQLFVNRAEIMGLYSDLAKTYRASLLDYSGDSLCLSTRYFYNSQHLNTEGTERFNATLVQDLRRLIRKD